MSGPLDGVRMVEIAGLGPGPFCAMLLADLGADVVRVDRASGSVLVGPNADPRAEVLHRGRRSVAVDLKHPAGREVVRALAASADALVEGFRPASPSGSASVPTTAPRSTRTYFDHASAHVEQYGASAV